MELSSFLCIIQDGCEEIQNAPLYSVVSTAAKERHQELLTFRSKPNRDNELWRQVTIRQLFLQLYREHKLGGDKTEMFLSHDEHLVAVQLSIAAWNKKMLSVCLLLKLNMSKIPSFLTSFLISFPPDLSKERGTFEADPQTPGSDKRSGCSEHLSRTPGSSSTMHGRVFPATTPKSHQPGMLQMVDSPRTPSTDIAEDTVVDVLSLYDEFIQKCGKVDVLDVFTRVREFFEQNNNELVIFKKEHVLVIDKLPRDQIEREMLKCLVGDDSVCCISTKEIPMEGLCWMKDRLGGCDIVKATVPLSFLWRSTDLAGYLCREPETALSVSSVSETAFSFVFEMRRVKTTSDSYSPLFEHAKALSEFVDIADKLLTITQDIADVDLAARKVLKTLKCTLSKSRTCSLRQASMKIVCEELLEETKHLFEAQIVDLKITPKPVGSGGSMRGQKVLRLFRTLLDVEATNISQNQGQDELVDQQASQGTPVRFPSLLSQFRSPSVQELPPTENVTEAEEKCKTPVSYTKSHYGWVAPSLILADELQPSVHPNISRSHQKNAEVHHRPRSSERSVTTSRLIKSRMKLL
ncbi:putative PCNA-interacting partner-like [Apostichopus japonicus]|uniref:PCNA-interacting partner n=1 Tax=Stichopus japonicus TaxID=307972 RepID=A0A2G8LHY4_STIJA|nr:putative PCNA-interacting partner-like [Apostichopus japonicus]